MKIFYNDLDKPIGELHEGVFRRLVKGSVHRMKKYDAWGVSKKVWDELPEGTEIRIKDEETGIVYIASYKEANHAKIADQYDNYELQYFLPLSIFKIK